MSLNPKEQLLELSALTQRYLLQEYGAKEWLTSDLENFLHFKTEAQLAKKVPTSAGVSIPQSVIASPPSEPSPQKLEAPPPPPLKQRVEKPLEKLVEKKAVPLPPEEKKQVANKPQFELEPLPKPQPADFSELRPLIAEKLPKLALRDSIPEQKNVLSPAGNAQAILLAPSTNTFLPSVAQAITTQLAPAILLDPEEMERQKAWEALTATPSARLLLVDDLTLRAYPALLKLYRPSDHPQGGTLGRIPALILSDVANLPLDPARKRTLWNDLKAALAS